MKTCGFCFTYSGFFLYNLVVLGVWDFSGMCARLSLTFNLNSSCGMTDTSNSGSMANSSCMRSNTCSDRSLTEDLPITNTWLKNWDTTVQGQQSTSEGRWVLQIRNMNKKHTPTQTTHTYWGNARFNGLHSPLEQHLGQVICLFIQVLDQQRKRQRWHYNLIVWTHLLV